MPLVVRFATSSSFCRFEGGASSAQSRAPSLTSSTFGCLKPAATFSSTMARPVDNFLPPEGFHDTRFDSPGAGRLVPFTAPVLIVESSKGAMASWSSCWDREPINVGI